MLAVAAGAVAATPGLPVTAPRGSLTLLAGSIDGPEAIDGAPPVARIADTSGNHTGNTPGIASNGNTLYLADMGNHAIREVSRLGVRTIAGKLGVPGATDGKGPDARFHWPAGIAINGSGELFIADSGNHTIRKISASGIVSTFAGRVGQAGSDDGIGASARFNQPQGVAIDSAGNLFVADRGNHTVRQISPSGRVVTLAGDSAQSGDRDGQGRAATFERPQGLAVDGRGNVYVTDSENSAIRRIAPDGRVETLKLVAAVAARGEPAGSVVSFNGPNGIAVEHDTGLVIVEEGSHRVRRVSAAGLVRNVAGNFDARNGSGSRDGPGLQARFFTPSAVTVGHGEAWIVDAGNATIRSISPSGQVTTLAGKARRRGASESVDGQGAAARFAFVSAVGESRAGLAVATNGDVFVAEAQKNVIRKITPAGAVSTIAGSDGQAGAVDGVGSAARFSQPAAVAVDPTGIVFVADTGNHTIRRIDRDGAVTTVAGQAGNAAFADGQGAAARFKSPLAVAIDPDGRLLVSDSGNHVLRMIDRFGAVTTWAGRPGAAGAADGPRSEARFERPSRLAVAAAGDVYVVDGAGETRVRRIAPGGLVTTPSNSAWRTPPLPRRELIEYTSRAFTGIAAGATGEVYVSSAGESVVWRVDRNGEVRVIAGDPDREGFLLGPLPGRLSDVGSLALRRSGELLLTSGNAVLTVTLGVD